MAEKEHLNGYVTDVTRDNLNPLKIDPTSTEWYVTYTQGKADLFGTAAVIRHCGVNAIFGILVYIEDDALLPAAFQVAEIGGKIAFVPVKGCNDPIVYMDENPHEQKKVASA